MSDLRNKPNRRDFLKTMGGVLGGISLLGHGFTRGQALGSMPNGYRFYRVLSANEGGRFGAVPNDLGDITGAVMMASPLSGTGVGYVYVHGITRSRPESPAVFAVLIDYDQTPPVIRTLWDVAIEGRALLGFGKTITVGHIGTGASNALGQYVTTIAPAERSPSVTVDNSPGVYLFRPVGSFGSFPIGSRIIGFADPVPSGGFYGGDFGDVAIDDDENLLLAAATTRSPSGTVSGFAGSQALIATSVGATTSGRVVLQTGDLLPSSSALVESIGLIDLAADQVFAAQVTARRMGPTATRSGTALVVGDTQAPAAEQRVIAASSELIPPDVAARHNITSGETFFGPRVDPRQDVAFVTHVGTFQRSIGSNDAEILSYYSRGLSRSLQRTQAIGSGDGSKVITLGAPCLDRTGLMYGTKLRGDGKTELVISDGVNSQTLLESGDVIDGRSPSGELTVSEILFGQHSTQVDAFGRLAFTAEFLIDPSKPEDPKNVITSLVIGIPK